MRNRQRLNGNRHRVWQRLPGARFNVLGCYSRYSALAAVIITSAPRTRWPPTCTAKRRTSTRCAIRASARSPKWCQKKHISNGYWYLRTLLDWPIQRPPRILTPTPRWYLRAYLESTPWFINCRDRNRRRGSVIPVVRRRSKTTWMRSCYKRTEVTDCTVG